MLIFNKNNMKKMTIIVTIVLVSITLKAQTISFEETSNATKKPKGKFTTYISKNGAEYKIGDDITIGIPSANGTFAFLKGDGLITPVGSNAPSSFSGRKGKIKKLWFAGTKKAGYQIVLKVEGLGGYLIYLEGAIQTGEVESFGMTSDQALSKLKKAKDKLELELISQEKYDSIKAKLIKYIK